MKILIRKKRLSSLSSLLVLTLLQPTANATESRITSTPAAYENSSEEADDKHQVKPQFLNTTAYRSYGSLKVPVSELQHLAYKNDISQVFDAYHAELEALEEGYQDNVDHVLDQYEADLKLARYQGKEEQEVEAKLCAERMLAALKQQRNLKRQALRSKFHIT